MGLKYVYKSKKIKIFCDHKFLSILKNYFGLSLHYHYYYHVIDQNNLDILNFRYFNLDILN